MSAPSSLNPHTQTIEAEYEKDVADIEEKGQSDDEVSTKEDPEVMRKLALSPEGPTGTVKRGLSERHLQLIALGGTIGTGLFIGLGSSLASAGPLSTLLAYSIMGILVWTLMIALGEVSRS
jgi:amino acid transporter